MSSPDFGFFTSRAFQGKTGKPYTMIRAADLPRGSETATVIAQICNEPAIYDVLFRQRCKGQPYTAKDAASFLDWAAKGWAGNGWFVFAVLDEDETGRQVGALDIKSNDLAGAEIGYWASAQHQGIMTPAVDILCRLAVQAGFKSLFAYMAVSNPRSQKVLLNNGFIQGSETVFHNENHCYVLRKTL